MSKELSLQELAKSKSWVIHSNRNYSESIEPNGIYARVAKAKKPSGLTTCVYFRFGVAVAKKLKVTSGGSLGIFYHPDDMLTCLLVKSDGGYRVNYEAKSDTVLRIGFTWKRPLILEEIGQTKVDYYHVPENNGIIFRIPQ